jgi:hypothetical protein
MWDRFPTGEQIYFFSHNAEIVSHPASYLALQVYTSLPPGLAAKTLPFIRTT